MKIRLIEPKAPGLNVYDQALLPRLGLPLLGRILRDAGHDVRIYVETLAPVDWIDAASADLVGFSTTTATAPAAYAMADRCRRLGVPTVIGGSHVTFLADEALEHCDLVVRGEGQKAILEVVAALRGERGYAGIAGLSYRDASGSIVHNPRRPNCSQEEFAALPAPDISLIVGHEQMTNVPIMTQWGCPFDCDFCSVITMFGRKVRARAIEDVLDELTTHRDRRSVFFYDDNFVVNKARTRELLRAMLDRGLTPRWSAQVRAEIVYKDKRTRELDHELLALMRDSGCRMVYCGFESVDPATLAAYNKHQDVQTIRDAVRAFHDYGISVHGMFVLGSDADDARIFAQTVRFAQGNRIDTVQFMMLTPCPGTAFSERVTSEGRLLSRDWSLYDGHFCLIQPAKMTPYELQVGTHEALARFYSLGCSLRMLFAKLARNLPFLLGMMLRERAFRRRLPRIVWMAVARSHRIHVFNELEKALSPCAWDRLQDLLVVPVLRLYGLRHLRQWARQAKARTYVEFLRRLPQPRGAGGSAIVAGA